MDGSAAAREQEPAVTLDDPGVVAGREAGGADPPREGEQLGEPEAAVAADARVRRLAPRVAAHERADDGAPEPLAEVEREVRDPEPVAGLARRDDRRGRAAGSIGVRPARVDPEAQRDPDRLVAGLAGAEERDCAVDPAAHRDGDPTVAPAGGRGLR